MNDPLFYIWFAMTTVSIIYIAWKGRDMELRLEEIERRGRGRKS